MISNHTNLRILSLKNKFSNHDPAIRSISANRSRFFLNTKTSLKQFDHVHLWSTLTRNEFIKTQFHMTHLKSICEPYNVHALRVKTANSHRKQNEHNIYNLDVTTDHKQIVLSDDDSTFFFNIITSYIT